MEEEYISMAAVEAAVSKQVSAIENSYRSRGLPAAARRFADEQIKQEEKTRAMEPDAYRLSGMSEAAISGIYRRGKETMSSSDVIRYFWEVRKKHTPVADLTPFSESFKTGDREERDLEVQRAEKKTALTPKNIAQKTVERIKSASKGLISAIPTWFDLKAPDTSSDRRRFPVSAFAAIGAVALSLSLIVAGSVITRRGEAEISRLKEEISKTAALSGELRSNLDANTDLLGIREIAMEEYGMIDENYVRSDYLTLQGEEEIETYRDETAQGIGLSELLSALGIKK